MSVSLSDQYVLLLEKVVEENRALREQVKQMAENEKTVIGDLHKKIDDLKTANCSQSRPARQTGTSLRVPKMCRVCFCCLYIACNVNILYSRVFWFHVYISIYGSRAGLFNFKRKC